MKRFYVTYESDEMVCNSYEHTYGAASTIKVAKSYISRIRKNQAEHDPRNFKVFDSWADIDPTTDHVPCVYQEA